MGQTQRTGGWARGAQCTLAGHLPREVARRRLPAAGAQQGLLTACGAGSTGGRLTGGSGLEGAAEVKVGGLGPPRPRDESQEEGGAQR